MKSKYNTLEEAESLLRSGYFDPGLDDDETEKIIHMFKMNNEYQSQIRELSSNESDYIKQKVETLYDQLESKSSEYKKPESIIIKPEIQTINNSSISKKKWWQIWK